MEEEISIEEFRLNPDFDLRQLEPIGIPKKKSRPPRHRTGEEFLKGPIPWAWLTVAARQTGKTLHVSLVLWKQAGMHKSPTVVLSMQQMTKWGVNRSTAYRALLALEHAGLVSVKRNRGRLARVTLLPLPSAITVKEDLSDMAVDEAQQDLDLGS